MARALIDTHKFLKDVGVNMKRNATFIECTSLAKKGGRLGAEKNMALGARFQKPVALDSQGLPSFSVNVLFL